MAVAKPRDDEHHDNQNAPPDDQVSQIRRIDNAKRKRPDSELPGLIKLIRVMTICQDQLRGAIDALMDPLQPIPSHVTIPENLVMPIYFVGTFSFGVRHPYRAHIQGYLNAIVTKERLQKYESSDHLSITLRIEGYLPPATHKTFRDLLNYIRQHPWFDPP